jgi:hypothetical protein
MKIRFSWFNPFRKPHRLIRDLIEAMKWMNNLEKENSEYRENVHKGNAALIGLLVQFVLLVILLEIGAIFID